MTILVARFSEANAIGICWMATFRGGELKPAGWDGLHSELCGWCVYPQAEKLKAINAFELREDAELQRRRYFEASPSVRRRLIRRAQGYDTPMPPAAEPVAEPPAPAQPMEAVVSGPADGAEEDWFR